MPGWFDLTELNYRQSCGVGALIDIAEHIVAGSISGGLVLEVIIAARELIAGFVEADAADIGAETDGMSAVRHRDIVNPLELMVPDHIRAFGVVAPTAEAIRHPDGGDAPGGRYLSLKRLGSPSSLTTSL
jgi:hypothetical protein